MTPNDNQVALPELPEPQKEVEVAGPHGAEVREALEDYFDADQLRVYATEAVRLNEPSGNSGQLPAGGEAVAEVGPGWTLRFVGSTPIAELCRQHPELRIGTKLYTHPAADALGAVRELAGKWREATGHDDFGCNEIRARNMAVENCADELESAITQAPAVRVTDEMVQAASDACCVVIDRRTGAKAWFAPETDDDIRKMLEAALGQGKAS